MRPKKITQRLIKNIACKIAEGYTFDRAATLCGISPSTFFNWKQLGEKPESEQIYKDFAAAIKNAVRFYEDEALQIVRNAAVIHRSWKAAAWILESVFPEKYGKKRRPNDDYAKE
jgi:hypothetical protein